MSYKDDQKKTRLLLKAFKLVDGYKFNSDVNRARRRERPVGARKLSGENVQTFIKSPPSAGGTK